MSKFCDCISGVCIGARKLDTETRCGVDGAQGWINSGHAVDWKKPPSDPQAHPFATPKKHSHYYKDVRHLDTIDVYRVLQLFGVTDHALGHAAKKIMFAGLRGAKDMSKDVQEAIDTLTRWQDMRAEEARAK